MKLFYSWQSDTPCEIGEDFVREALESAIADLEVSEAVRPTVDQDTAGVRGNPVIAETIFQKIRSANLFIADVTVTGGTHHDDKALINSNVAVELGFAIGVHGDEVLLTVMNTHYAAETDALHVILNAVYEAAGVVNR